jgi:hypothetical protein
MDKGIWATWYDLEDDRKDDFLVWLHGEYLPFLREKPSYLWVAHYADSAGGEAMRRLREEIIVRPEEDVGSGAQFLIVVGAASPQAFLDPSVLEPDPDAAFRDMLALRRGVRTCLFIEETRVDGPAPRDPDDGLTLAPAIQMGGFRMRTVEQEVDLARWYRLLRLPSMARTPGCVAARKLLSIAGWAKHAIIYEFASLEDRLRYFEKPQEAKTLDPEHWTGRIARTTVHTPGSPTVGARTWPPVR